VATVAVRELYHLKLLVFQRSKECTEVRYTRPDAIADVLNVLIVLRQVLKGQRHCTSGVPYRLVAAGKPGNIVDDWLRSSVVLITVS